MRRTARLVLYAGTLAAVAGWSYVHASAIGHYDLAGTARLAWEAVYAVALCLAAYGVGLPDLQASLRPALGWSVAAVLLATGAISVIGLAAGSALVPRFVLVAAAWSLVPWYVACCVLANAGRAREAKRVRVVAVATAEEATALAEEMGRRPERPAALVAVLSPGEARPLGRSPKPLVEAALSNRCSVVVLDRAAQADEAIVAQAALLHANGLRVRTLSLFYDEWLAKLPATELERVGLMFDIGELHRARYGRLKRIFDVVAAGTGLILMVAVVPLVLLGNLLGNRGRLLYRQPRVGRRNEVFDIIKFRTMRDGESTHWTAEGDPRITPFGWFMRRTHLDELPQCINILRGQQSVVGPRPEQLTYVEELLEKIPYYGMRHLVRPGLTGWAQVKYPYGASELDATEKLQYEFWYLRHQSLTLDLRILGRTIRSVLGRQGR